VTAKVAYPEGKLVHKTGNHGYSKCGISEHDGIKRTMLDRFVTCPECRDIVKAQRAAARARNLGTS
jgi:hypothetical protein